MNNNSNSAMFSVGSYSGVPGQMCCSMLWMWPRDCSVQFICRSVQLCYPIATLRIQTALYVTVFIYVTDFCSWLSSTSSPNEDCEIVCVGVQELLLPSPAAEQACLFDSWCGFIPPSHCVWHWGASQPHLLSLDIQLKTGNKVDQPRTDAEVCIPSRKRSQCIIIRARSSVKVLTVWKWQ